jgi:RNase P/RNase MRP subunit POP5
MVISKINIPARWIHRKNKGTSENKSRFKVYLLQQKSIRKLYALGLQTYLDHWAASSNINIEWQDLKEVILKAANEDLGRRSKRKCKRRLQIWTKEIQKTINDKK